MAHGPGRIEIDPDGSFREAARRSLAVRGPELLVHREGTLAGGDIEALHQMRVASRRLRAVLEVYGGCFPARNNAQPCQSRLGTTRSTPPSFSKAGTFQNAPPKLTS